MSPGPDRDAWIALWVLALAMFFLVLSSSPEKTGAMHAPWDGGYDVPVLLSPPTTPATPTPPPLPDTAILPEHQLIQEVAGKDAQLICRDRSEWPDAEAMKHGGNIVYAYAWVGVGPIVLGPDACVDLQHLYAGDRSINEARALLALIHEAMHVKGVSDESAAECAAIQLYPKYAPKSLLSLGLQVHNGLPDNYRRCAVVRVPGRTRGWSDSHLCRVERVQGRRSFVRLERCSLDSPHGETHHRLRPERSGDTRQGASEDHDSVR